MQEIVLEAHRSIQSNKERERAADGRLGKIISLSCENIDESLELNKSAEEKYQSEQKKS